MIEYFCFSQQQPVCCTGNHFKGLVVVGCSPSKSSVTWSLMFTFWRYNFNSQRQPCLIPSSKYLDWFPRICIPDLLVSFISYFLSFLHQQTGQTVRPLTRVSSSLQTCLILILQTWFTLSPLFSFWYPSSFTVIDIVFPNTLVRL